MCSFCQQRSAVKTQTTKYNITEVPIHHMGISHGLKSNDDENVVAADV